MKNGFVTWYAEPLDPETNRVIAESLPEENACFGKTCADGVRRHLWLCNHSTVAHLERAKMSLRLRFHIYVQQGRRGKIRRWAFEKE